MSQREKAEKGPPGREALDPEPSGSRGVKKRKKRNLQEGWKKRANHWKQGDAKP